MDDCICPLDYRYGRKEMKRIFSEEGRILYQMKVEAALAKAHATLKTISHEDAKEIERVSNLDVVKVSRIKEIEKDTNHDLMAMVKAMTEKCNGDAGKYVHLGATSNDIVDTATALQIKEALKVIDSDVSDMLLTLATIAKRERRTLQVGRTHAQFAIPITFGFKMAGYIAELLRHRERIQEIVPRACAGKMAGAVGTGAALGDNFLRIQTEVMMNLGLTYEPAATQVVGRDRYTELICLLANIGTTMERLGTEIRNLQRSEIAEVSEPFNSDKQVGSSTMPQKRNPISSENVTGLARILRGLVVPTFENQVLWHERDLSNSSAERFTIPHAFTLLDEMIVKMNTVMGGLEVHSDRMLRNMESARGLIMAEPMMILMTSKGIGRQDAHEIMRESSMEALRRDVDLTVILLERRDVTSVLTEREIRDRMNPLGYIGKSVEITDSMVKSVEMMREMMPHGL